MSPVVGFKCWKTGQDVPIEDAFEHFHVEHRLMMGPSIQAIVNSATDDRRMAGAGVSASMGSPTETCRRQILIERFVDFIMDPRDLDEAEEGTMFHSAFLKRGVGIEGWGFEHPLPGPQDLDHELVRENPKHGFPEMEILPGVWHSCIVDMFTSDWRAIHDLKTKRAARTFYPPSMGVKVQLGLNALSAEKLGRTDEVQELGV